MDIINKILIFVYKNTKIKNMAKKLTTQEFIEKAL